MGNVMCSSAVIKIAVFHNEPFVAAGLVDTLRRQPDFTLEQAAWQGSWLERLERCHADVVVADYESALGLIAAARAGRRAQAALARVLVLTGRETESEIRHAFACGVQGYQTLGGGLADLFDGVRSIHQGARYLCPVAARRLADSAAGKGLTERESDVLRLVVEGCCNKTVARKLAIAPDTVKGHMKAILQKLDANNRTQAAAVAERRGLFKRSGEMVC